MLIKPTSVSHTTVSNHYNYLGGRDTKAHGAKYSATPTANARKIGTRYIIPNSNGVYRRNIDIMGNVRTDTLHHIKSDMGNLVRKGHSKRKHKQTLYNMVLSFNPHDFANQSRYETIKDSRQLLAHFMKTAFPKPIAWTGHLQNDNQNHILHWHIALNAVRTDSGHRTVSHKYTRPKSLQNNLQKTLTWFNHHHNYNLRPMAQRGINADGKRSLSRRQTKVYKAVAPVLDKICQEPKLTSQSKFRRELRQRLDKSVQVKFTRTGCSYAVFSKHQLALLAKRRRLLKLKRATKDKTKIKSLKKQLRPINRTLRRITFVKSSNIQRVDSNFSNKHLKHLLATNRKTLAHQRKVHAKEKHQSNTVASLYPRWSASMSNQIKSTSVDIDNQNAKASSAMAMQSTASQQLLVSLNTNQMPKKPLEITDDDNIGLRTQHRIKPSNMQRIYQWGGVYRPRDILNYGGLTSAGKQSLPFIYGSALKTDEIKRPNEPDLFKVASSAYQTTPTDDSLINKYIRRPFKNIWNFSKRGFEIGKTYFEILRHDGYKQSKRWLVQTHQYWLTGKKNQMVLPTPKNVVKHHHHFMWKNIWSSIKSKTGYALNTVSNMVNRYKYVIHNSMTRFDNLITNKNNGSNASSNANLAIYNDNNSLSEYHSETDYTKQTTAQLLMAHKSGYPLSRALNSASNADNHLGTSMFSKPISATYPNYQKFIHQRNHEQNIINKKQQDKNIKKYVAEMAKNKQEARANRHEPRIHHRPNHSIDIS